MSLFRSIDEADVAGKRVLMRADMNVPMQGGAVSDATRLERVLPTIQALTSRDAKVILLSHFGRPKGKRVPEMSLKPVADKLDALLPETTVHFAADCVGPEAEKAIDTLPDGGVVVLENTRFHPGEETNDPEFTRQLATLGDLFVNDAFSVSHRTASSTVGIANDLPTYAGHQMAAELDALTRVLDHPDRPVGAVVGGAKISTKISVLTNLVKKLDCVIIGGGMANTFLYARGVDVGKSLCEPDLAETAREIMETAEDTGCDILLPLDVVVAEDFRAGAASEVCALDQVPADGMILDVGPATCEALKSQLTELKTLLWNGPLGAFEIEPFGEGTFELARAAARLTQDGKLTTVAGGGDTVAALNEAGVTGDFTYVSTAGGAFLEWLEGKELPGVAALRGS